MRPIRVFAISLLFLLLAVPYGCVREPHAPMRVGTNVWPGYEPLYLARGLGYLDATSAHLVEYTSSIDVIRSFRNGTIEAAALTLDETLLLAQDFPDLSVVLVMDVSNGADVIMGHPPMKNLADIRGKLVGLEKTALGTYMLERAFDVSGLQLKDVRLKQLEASEHEKAFKAGEVDAVVTFEPVKTALLRTGARALFNSSQIPDEIVDVLVVRNDYLVDHPEEVQGLVMAYFRAIAYLKTNPEDAARRIAPRLHISEDQALASFNGMILGDMKKNMELLSGPHPRLLDTAERLANFMHRHELVLNERAPKNIFYPRIVERLNR